MMISVCWELELPNDLGLMKLLYAQGYPKGVVLDVMELWPRVYCINFHDSKPILESQTIATKPPFVWPTLQWQTDHRPIFDHQLHPEGSEAPRSLLQLPGAFDVLTDFFQPRPSFLNETLPNIDFPDFVLAALDRCGKVARRDRYLIFTDGSSMCKAKHAPPAWVGEHDLTDS